MRLAGIGAGVLYGSGMAEDQLTCRRTGCNRTAAASLSFRYETRQVWVVAPPAGETGTRYDLCAEHANGTTVPRGWHRVDQRQEARRAAPPAPLPEPEPPAPEWVEPEPAEPVAETPPPAPAPPQRKASEAPDPKPAGRKRTATKRTNGATALAEQAAEESPAPQPDAATATQNRYARLLSDLPRLAVPQGGRAVAGRDEEPVVQVAIAVPDAREAGAVVVSLTELAGARRDRESAPS